MRVNRMGVMMGSRRWRVVCFGDGFKSGTIPTGE